MQAPGRACVAEALSTRADTAAACREALEKAEASAGPNPDVALVFLSPHHASRSQEVLEAARGMLGADSVAGCTASGVIGGGREVQRGPGLAVWCARLPGTRVQAFHLRLEETKHGSFVRGWPEVDASASAVLLGDPFTFPVEPFLNSLRRGKRAPRLVGGVASAFERPGGNRLLADDRVYNGGAAGFVMAGAFALQPLVSPGCRPVGKPFVVTRCQGRVIYELGGAPASETLGEMMRGLDEKDRLRFSQAPQVGLRAVSDKATGESAGGYLIRGLVSVDPQAGSLAVTEHVRTGLQLQFHARDSDSAHEELQNLLELASGLQADAAGALMFCCTGRGEHMFRAPDHDVAAVRAYFPRLPVAGMFAAGEIGPVLGQPYLHGFTASLAFVVRAAG